MKAGVVASCGGSRWTSGEGALRGAGWFGGAPATVEPMSVYVGVGVGCAMDADSRECWLDDAIDS